MRRILFRPGCGLVAVAAAALACELSPTGEKDRCHDQADCLAGFVCQSGVCRRWLDVPGIVSDEPFTGTELFLVNLVAPGSYQVVLEYDATDSGVAISVAFGNGSASYSSEKGMGRLFSSSSMEMDGGAYVLEIGAASGVTVNQVSVLAWPAGPMCGNTGMGFYCGNDTMTQAVASTLYHCPGSNRDPDSATPCPSGRCVVEAPGIPDHCDGLMCNDTGMGFYCGSNKMSNADANTLYHCPASNSAPDGLEYCQNGCTIEAPGTPDHCN